MIEHVKGYKRKAHKRAGGHVNGYDRKGATVDAAQVKGYERVVVRKKTKAKSKK